MGRRESPAFPELDRAHAPDAGVALLAHRVHSGLLVVRDLAEGSVPRGLVAHKEPLHMGEQLVETVPDPVARAERRDPHAVAVAARVSTCVVVAPVVLALGPADELDGLPWLVVGAYLLSGFPLHRFTFMVVSISSCSSTT